MADLNSSPSASRIHIGFFGKRNSGKSSLVNAFCGQNVSIVSPLAGTTTDPVYRAMEIHGLGACVLIDTAGFDEEKELGLSRVRKTEEAAIKTDIAVLLFSGENLELEIKWLNFFRSKKIPILPVISQADKLTLEQKKNILDKLAALNLGNILEISSKTKLGIEALRVGLIAALPYGGAQELTAGLCTSGDIVLLIMPQDPQSPKGRLILPQAQTIRELLDKNCQIICSTSEGMNAALQSLVKAPELIITDSQCFNKVWQQKPEGSKLVSFSILFAAQKGDLPYFTESAGKINLLTENDRVLIAESCTHAPMTEDIGRVKIPALLRKKIGEKLSIDICSGTDFPKDLSKYSLIIHCGGCMFNRRHIMSRVEMAKAQNIPMTNYGIALAALTGILDKISLPVCS